MSAPTTFNFSAFIIDPGILPGMTERLKDFSPALADIIDEWAVGNVDKFAGSVGAELSGYTPDPDVFWPEVTAQYYREKHGPIDQKWYAARGIEPRETYPDHLMVKTGNLRDSLTHPDQFAQAILPTRAAFGLPLDEEATDALLGNLEIRGRQTVFLGEMDRDHIASTITQFLYGRGKYASEGAALDVDADVQGEFFFPGGA
jgi:hypothetical protein